MLLNMQLVSVWLTLGLSHLLADFVLQRDAVIEGKARHSMRAYAEHGVVHLVVMTTMLVVFTGSTALTTRTMGVLMVLAGVHIGLDIAKERLGGGSAELPRRWPFIADQVLHFLVITIASVLICPLTPTDGALAAWARISDQALVLVFGYTAVVFAAGHLNAVLLKPFSDLYGLGGYAEQKEPENGNRGQGLARAGMIIGILERFLIMTAVLAGSATGVGLVIAAKSVFRFEDAKKGRQKAEYFLIGTFLSVAEAVLGGVIVLRFLDFTTSAG